MTREDVEDLFPEFQISSNGWSSRSWLETLDGRLQFRLHTSQIMFQIHPEHKNGIFPMFVHSIQFFLNGLSLCDPIGK